MIDTSWAYAIGWALGSFLVFLFIAAIVLFLSKRHRDRPSPYIAAGVLCFLFALVSAKSAYDGPNWVGLYACIVWIYWRYKRSSNSTPSRLGRANAIWLGLLLLTSVWALSSRDMSVPSLLAAVGIFSVMTAALVKWVLLAPKKQT